MTKMSSGSRRGQNAGDAEIGQPAQLGRVLGGAEHRGVLPVRLEPDHLAEIRRGAGIEHRERRRRLVRHAAEVRGRMRGLVSLLQRTPPDRPLCASTHLLLVLDVRRPGSEQRDAASARRSAPSSASTRPSRRKSVSSFATIAPIMRHPGCCRAATHVVEVDALELRVADVGGGEIFQQPTALHDADATRDFPARGRDRASPSERRRRRPRVSAAARRTRSPPSDRGRTAAHRAAARARPWRARSRARPSAACPSSSARPRMSAALAGEIDAVEQAASSRAAIAVAACRRAA